MPIVPTGGSPYPIINEVMDIARLRVNDMMNGTEGDLLANDVPASQTALTAAWRWYQARCDTAGVQTFKKEIVLFGVPQRANNDVANQAWITWGGCSDGINQFDGPVLPQDLISPKSFWRRRTSALDDSGMRVENSAAFSLMDQATDGLPRYINCNVYDWRDDGVYFYAAEYAQDILLTYSAYRAPLDIQTPDAIVPMMFCEDCLGARVAFEYASARGAAQAPAMEQWAETAFGTIGQRATKIKGRQNIRRIGYTGRGGSGRDRYANWPVTPIT